MLTDLCKTIFAKKHYRRCLAVRQMQRWADFIFAFHWETQLSFYELSFSKS